MSSPVHDVAVVGGGIVGLATAQSLSAQGVEVVVLEAESELALHQTGRNSGVIHSGLYYRPGSDKARFCASGRDALYSFCEQHGIAHRRCGKLVVAVDDSELPALERLAQRAQANGLEGVERLDASGIRDREPTAVGVGALWVPQTGIVDFSRVAVRLAEMISSKGGQISTSARVRKVATDAGAITIDDRVLAGPNAVLAWKREGYRASDFSVRDTADTLLFPGFWRLAAGFWRTGAGEMYRSWNRAAFVEGLQRLMPSVTAEQLAPSRSGVRAQAIDARGRLLDDFQILQADRMLHVLNAPSPAATDALAIGSHLAEVASTALP